MASSRGEGSGDGHGAGAGGDPRGESEVTLWKTVIARALEGVARPPVGTRPLVPSACPAGVDSNVSAALLQRVGWNVAGGFIKNWSDSKDGWTGSAPGAASGAMRCGWRPRSAFRS